MVRRLSSGADHLSQRLVRVTARLQSGAVLPSWFPAPLDGLLASTARRARLGARYGSEVDHHTERLPLRRVRDGLGARWVWAATCATPVGTTDEETRWWHQRWDVVPSEQVVDRLPARTGSGAGVGRWKIARVPYSVTVTAALEWWAVGDPAEIRRLCEATPSVGKKRAMGEGMVLDWTVEDVDVPAWEPICWHADGTIARPFPVRAATVLGVDTPETVQHTYRPPYWRPPQAEVEHGGFMRTLPEVVAPWTTRDRATTMR